MKHLQTFNSFLNEGKDEIIFSVNDEKLDHLLHDFHKRELDYKDIKGDSFYVLPKREFDRFIDTADSSGFDVDYENSEDSVVYVQESRVNEAVSPEVHKMVNKFVKGMADKFDYPLQDAVYAILDVLKSQNYKGLKESKVNEAQNFDIKDLPKGAILTFNDGETWMVTKVVGNSSDPRGYLLAPYGKTKEYYISMQIEFSIKKLEDDLVAVN